MHYGIGDIVVSTLEQHLDGQETIPDELKFHLAKDGSCIKVWANEQHPKVHFKVSDLAYMKYAFIAMSP